MNIPLAQNTKEQSMLNKKRIFYGVFLIILASGLYMLYQMVYKPWLPTEITLMNKYDTNKATLLSNKRDSMTTYYYIVKNAPYTLKGRYKMVEDVLKSKSPLYPKEGSHRRNYSFTKEGWSFSGSFPYFKYIDRTYKESPLTYRDIGEYDVADPDALIPYGGANGFMGDSIANYDLDISDKDCKMYNTLSIYRSFMFIDLFAKNIEYDSTNSDERFYFSSGFYTPPISKCEGFVNEGDKVIKGLRL